MFAGQKDTRQLESVLRAVTDGRNKMHAIWATLAALQAAGVTAEDPSWTLLRGLNISTAADVLSSLQVVENWPLFWAACTKAVRARWSSKVLDQRTAPADSIC
jgi:hypothetical protein